MVLNIGRYWGNFNIYANTGIPLAFNRKVSRGSTVSVSHISPAAPWLGEPIAISVEAHQFDKQDQTFWHMPRIKLV